MARESGLWTWLKKAQLALLEDLHMNRVENSVMRGMPDVEGQVRLHGQFWIELKSAERPARPETPIRFKFQPGQPEWLVKRRQAGGLSWMLVQVGSGAERRIYLLSGMSAHAVAAGAPENWLQAHDHLRLKKPRPEDVVYIAAGGIPKL